jgi:hypothetical protein
MDVDVEVVDGAEGMLMPMWMEVPTYILLLDVMFLLLTVSADHNAPSMTEGHS